MERLDGCCWQDGNSFEYWKGGQQNKRLWLFLQMSFDAALDGLLGGGCTAINERFMHSGGRRVIPPSPAGASSQRTWKKEEKGGDPFPFHLPKRSQEKHQPPHLHVTQFNVVVVLYSPGRAGPELNCRPQSSRFQRLGLFLSSKSVKATTPPKVFLF